MRILIAPDKFKGTLEATAVAEIIAQGLEGHEVREMPIADGGEGTARALCTALGGHWFEVPVTGPLGDPVNAGIAVVQSEEGTLAVIEMSSASGIALLAGQELDPWQASTKGTGELLQAAADTGADRIIIGIGGSATNDGGAGMAEALGFRFLDADGVEIEDIPAGLTEVESLFPDLAVLLPEVVVACDVTNPLLGENGATRIYGPQKGVKEEDFERFELRLQRFAEAVAAEKGIDARDVPGAGAAGGLGFGLLSFCEAQLRPGFDLVAEILGIEEAVQWADVVITGEGSLDAQSLMGKGPGGIAKMAQEAGKKVAAFCGCSDNAAGLDKLFENVFPLVDGEVTAEQAMADPAQHLKNKVAQARPIIDQWAQ